jgi:hypothetical protein
VRSARRHKGRGVSPGISPIHRVRARGGGRQRYCQFPLPIFRWATLQTISNQSIHCRPLTRAAELYIRPILGLTPQALRCRALRALGESTI